MARTNKNSNLPPGVPPSLTTELSNLYNSLDANNRIIFIKVFKFLWGVVCPASRFISYSGVLYSYWVVDLLRERSGLTTSYLSLLTYIYHVTRKGTTYIHSKVIYSGVVLPGVLAVSIQQYVSTLIKLGYLSRSQYKPASTTLPRSFAYRPVFIRLTPSGVRLIETIERDLHNILMNTSLDELTGQTNKKA